MNLKTIVVQGKGTVSQPPDRIRIFFILQGKDSDFSEAASQCNRRFHALRSAAESCSIAAADVKTIQFDVREETEYLSGRHQHVGFLSTHLLCVALPINNELVGRFLSAVARSEAKPQVKLEFEVSDPEDLKRRVLEGAVENARRRAETIAAAAGVTLGSIVTIQHGYSEVRISSSHSGEIEMEACAGSGEITPEFQPDDIVARDTVTVTWEINS